LDTGAALSYSYQLATTLKGAKMAIAASGGSATTTTLEPSAIEHGLRPLTQAVARIVVEIPPLYTTTAAVLAGDALGNFHFFVPLWIAVALTALSAGLFLVRRNAPAIVTALSAIVLAATAPVHQLLVPMRTATSLARFSDDSTITVEGQIVSSPEHVEWDRTYIYVHATRAGLTPESFKPASGIVRITIRGRRDFSIGDQVRATARIRFPRNDGNPGEFDYRAWLMRNGIAATIFTGNSHRHAAAAITKIGHANLFPAEQIAAIRERIGMFIDTNLPYPEGAEMRALIIGDRGGVDEGLRVRLALTGMAHLLVISGLHLGFVAAAVFYAVRLLMGFFPALMARGYANKFSAAAGAIAVCAYASIAGSHVSTVRALIMVLAYAGAILIERTRELLASLALAALVICLALPGSTAGIGFQLSFASVCVILLGDASMCGVVALALRESAGAAGTAVARESSS
jgi:competence protein ComEC